MGKQWLRGRSGFLPLFTGAPHPANQVSQEASMPGDVSGMSLPQRDTLCVFLRPRPGEESGHEDKTRCQGLSRAVGPRKVNPPV